MTFSCDKQIPAIMTGQIGYTTCHYQVGPTFSGSLYVYCPGQEVLCDPENGGISPIANQRGEVHVNIQPGDWLQPGQYSVKVALQVNGGITDSGPAYRPSEQVETVSFLVTAPNAQPGATEQVTCPAETTVQMSQSVQITCTVATPDFRGDMLVYTRPSENIPLEGNYFRFDMSQGPATFTVSLPGDHFAQPGRVVHRVRVAPDGYYADGTLQLRYIDLVINVVEPPAV